MLLCNEAVSTVRMQVVNTSFNSTDLPAKGVCNAFGAYMKWDD